MDYTTWTNEGFFSTQELMVGDLSLLATSHRAELNATKIQSEMIDLNWKPKRCSRRIQSGRLLLLVDSHCIHLHRTGRDTLRFPSFELHTYNICAKHTHVRRSLHDTWYVSGVPLVLVCGLLRLTNIYRQDMAVMMHRQRNSHCFHQ